MADCRLSLLTICRPYSAIVSAILSYSCEVGIITPANSENSTARCGLLSKYCTGVAFNSSIYFLTAATAFLSLLSSALSKAALIFEFGLSFFNTSSIIYSSGATQLRSSSSAFCSVTSKSDSLVVSSHIALSRFLYVSASTILPFACLISSILFSSSAQTPRRACALPSAVLSEALRFSFFIRRKTLFKSYGENLRFPDGVKPSNILLSAYSAINFLFHLVKSDFSCSLIF